MKISELNEYLQTLAAFGAIIALITVGYEIRQSNRIATQQALSANWSNWLDHANSSIESKVSDVIVKSMTAEDEMSLEDKVDLDFYLSSWFYLHHHDYISLQYDNEVELTKYILQDIAGDAPTVLSSRFSRAWFSKNKYWMDPEIVNAVEEAIAKSPVGSGLKYYRDIDTQAETIE